MYLLFNVLFIYLHLLTYTYRVKSPFRALVPAYILDIMSPLFAHAGNKIWLDHNDFFLLPLVTFKLFTVIEYPFKMLIVFYAFIWILCDSKPHQLEIEDCSTECALKTHRYG